MTDNSSKAVSTALHRRNTGSRVRVDIVVPVYNEQEVLQIFHRELTLVIDKLTAYDFSIIYVDDGSTDKTPNIIENLAVGDKRVAYLTLSRNFGHQIALTAGLDYADGHVVITMDSDLQHPPEKIPDMLEKWNLGYDAVFMQKIATEKRGKFIDALALFFYWGFNKISDTKIDPNASDFRLIDRKIVTHVRNFKEKQRFLRGVFRYIGMRSITLSYIAPERAAGKPSYTFLKLAELALSGFFAFSNFPLKIPLVIGSVVISTFLLYTFYLVVLRLSTNYAPPGFTSLFVFLALTQGLNFLFMGFLGAYIAKIFDEIKNRPLYIVSKKEFPHGHE